MISVSWQEPRPAVRREARAANVAANIIALFGGIRPMARKIGKKPTTVGSWKVAGRIPSKHQDEVLAAAKGLGIGLKPADFFASADDATAEPAAPGEPLSGAA